MKRANRGFSLVEVLTVVAVVAVLGGIAWPSYKSYVQRSLRGEAAASLTAIQVKMDSHRGENPLYPDDAEARAAFGAGAFESPSFTYAITSDAEDGAYTIVATATDDRDVDCSEMNLEFEAGSVTRSPAECF